ncbi:MAG: DUF6524 family protein [Woeseiaceae bacterium]|nr:DUF6524 family protein [Woeseiaceae bacterium]
MAGNTRSREFTAGSVLWRLLASLFLVLVTFNPSGVSAYHWISDAVQAGNFGPLHLLTIGLLLIGWTILGYATIRALNLLGLVLASIVIGSLVWLLVDYGVLDADSTSAKAWIGLVSLAIVLGIGTSWAHIWRRITGQVSVDHVED